MIIQGIKKLKNLNFLLAYSGGIDSTFLLHQLLKIRKIRPQFQFRTIHINHQLNQYSSSWSQHCKKTCEKYNIPILIKKITINKKKIGIEAASRLQRYKTIFNEALPKEIILIAHNLDDQCETFFLSLKRGSGISGLSGMPNKRKLFNKNVIVRPMLNITRSEIKNWMIKNKIPWIEDKSNYDLSYDRNFLRQKIFPLIETKWPNFINKCAKSISILKKEKNILDSTINKKLQKCLVSKSILNIKNFNTMSPSIRNLLLRMWIKKNNFVVPSHKIITNIYYEIILSKINSQAKIQISNYEIKKYQYKLYITHTMPCIKKMILMWYFPWKNLKLPNKLGYITQNKYGTTLPCPKKNELVNIRFQISGKISIHSNKKAKLIKKMWKENKIASWNRNNIPLLFYNNKFISALGVFTSSKQHQKNIKSTWNLSWINKIDKQS
ncbi:MAG: tRNA lysidine(34) synthetase TilS [Buchnera aphidicola (Nurudea shiraii)]